MPLPPLVSDPSDCRDVCPFVTPAPKFPSRRARCPKMSKMWTKSAQNRLGHAAVAQWFDWLPDVLALFMGKGEGLSIWVASRSSLKKTELTKLLWIGHQTQPWTKRSQEHLRSFNVWQTSRSPVYRTLICALPSSWLYMLCAQHPIEALNCMRQIYSFVFARVTSLYCLLRSRDLKFESYEAELEHWLELQEVS